MPRFPYLSAIFALLCLLAAAVFVPETRQLVPPIADIENELAARLTTDVEIDGPVRLRFLPRPQLIINAVSISQGSAAQDLVAITVPHLVVNLDILELLQRRFSVASITLIEPTVAIEIIGNIADFAIRMQNRKLPAVALLDGNFRVTGLNMLQPQQVAAIDGLSVFVEEGAANDPLSLKAHKVMPNGQTASLDMFVRSAPRQTEFITSFALGTQERLKFDGFISTVGPSWRLEGEVEMNSSALVARVVEAGLPLQILPEARGVRLSGLVRGDSTGLLAESMEIEALNTIFRSRLAFDWPRETNAPPVLIGRLTTGAINLDLLSLSYAEPGNPTLLSSVWQSFAPSLAIDLRLESTRFDLGGETGSDMVVAFDWRDGVVDIERLNLGLPFRSSLLLAGRLDLTDARPGFNGNFSARSSDSSAALLWAGDRFGVDLADLLERLDETRLQRTSLVGDVLFDKDALNLSGLAGRISDDFLTADIVIGDIAGPQVDAVLRFDRLDLADFGVVEAGTAARDKERAAVWPQVNRLIAGYLKQADTRRKITLDVGVQEMYSGVQFIGPMALRADIADQSVTFRDTRFGNLSGAEIGVSGKLNYDAAPSHGRMTFDIESRSSEWMQPWLLSGLGPVETRTDLPSSFIAKLDLSAPDAPDWPIVKLQGDGRIGDTKASFVLATPSRSLSLSEAGSDMQIILVGAANALADAFSLPKAYQQAESGSFSLDLTAQSNELSLLTAELGMADDAVSLNGTLRPTAAGVRLEGAVDFKLRDVLLLLDEDADWAQSLAIFGKTQLSATRDAIGFSGLELGLGEGTISGEGVLQLSNSLPRLNMNVAANGLDMSWVMPDWTADGWASADMNWSLLGRSNSEITLRATALRFGDIVLDSLEGRAKIIDGVMEAPSVAVDMMQGTASLNIQAEGGSLPPQFRVEGNFSGFNPSGNLLALYGNRLVDADFDGAVNLAGRGTSVTEMMGSLTGLLRYEIAPGVISVFDAAGFADAVSAVDYSGVATPLVKQFQGQHDLAFARGVGLAELSDGRIESASTDFVFSEGLNEAQLRVAFDAVTRQLAGDFTFYPVDRQRAVAWQLSGDVMKPKYQGNASDFDLKAPPGSSAISPPAE